MSKNPNSKKKRTKLFQKIMVIIMLVVMLGGIVASILPYFIS